MDISLLPDNVSTAAVTAIHHNNCGTASQKNAGYSWLYIVPFHPDLVLSSLDEQPIQESMVYKLLI